MDHHKHHEDLRNGNHAKFDSEVSRATSPGGFGSMDNGDSTDAQQEARRNRPRTFPYFRTLPYQVEDNAQRQKNLAEILKHLYIAIQAGDFTPGAVHWTRELRSWLSLKFDPTREQRVQLVKLYYELALAPGIDPGVAERFSSMFMLLTKYVVHCRMDFSSQDANNCDQAQALSTTAQRPDIGLAPSLPRTQDIRATQREWTAASHQLQEKYQDIDQNHIICAIVL
jgi:hypothetical protein